MQMSCHSLCLFSVIYRKVKDMEGQLSLLHQNLEVTKAQCDKKEAECVEKDSQVKVAQTDAIFILFRFKVIRLCNLHNRTYCHSYHSHEVSLSSWIHPMQINVLKSQISQLPFSAGKHALENHQKVKGLEVFVEQMNTAKSLARTASMGHHLDYSNADFAAKRRIEELEALAEKRLREVRTMSFSLHVFFDSKLPAGSMMMLTIGVDAGVCVEYETCGDRKYHARCHPRNCWRKVGY